MRLSTLTETSEGEPVDRLGRIADAMIKAAEKHPEHREEDRAIVMLDSGDDGMIAHDGYEREEGAEAFVNMLGHLSMLAEVNGMQLNFVPLAKAPGEG